MKRYHRQFIHILGMLPFAILAFYIDNGISREFFLFLACLFLILVFSLEIFRLRRQHLHPSFMAKISHLYKDHEKNRLLSTVLSPIILILLGLFFSKITMVATVCMAGFSDSMAAIIGMKYGGKKNRSGKTWAGSITYFTFTSLFSWLTFYLIAFPINIFFIIMLSLVVALLERFCTSHKSLLLDDDFLVPLFFAIVMEIGIRFI